MYNNSEDYLHHLHFLYVVIDVGVGIFTLV